MCIIGIEIRTNYHNKNFALRLIRISALLTKAFTEALSQQFQLRSCEPITTLDSKYPRMRIPQVTLHVAFRGRHVLGRESLSINYRNGTDNATN